VSGPFGLRAARVLDRWLRDGTKPCATEGCRRRGIRMNRFGAMVLHKCEDHSDVTARKIPMAALVLETEELIDEANARPSVRALKTEGT
jgi:hypothetical protein